MFASLFQPLRLWRREVRPTFALALPIMAGLVSQTLMGLVDTIMVGRVRVVCRWPPGAALPSVWRGGLIGNRAMAARTKPSRRPGPKPFPNTARYLEVTRLRIGAQCGCVRAVDTRRAPGASDVSSRD